MKNELNFDVIIDRLKNALYLTKDSQIAELIGMSTSAFCNLKKRDSIPFDKVITLATSKGISLDWLMSKYPEKSDTNTPEIKSVKDNTSITKIISTISGLTTDQIDEISFIALEKRRINNLELEIKILNEQFNISNAH